MAKPTFIELREGKTVHCFPILFEDRSALAIDKARHWMLVPFTWQRTNRNLQAAITSSLGARDFWARARNLKYLHYVHRLDADTTGVLLFAKSTGALRTLSDLFESRRMEKRYLAVVSGVPHRREWTCDLRIAPDPRQIGRMKASLDGREAETSFQVIETRGDLSLVEARPVTGRTHQIRIHLMQSGFPVVGDDLYGTAAARKNFELGLRAVSLAYTDPFTRRRICIEAETKTFLTEYGFGVGGAPH